MKSILSSTFLISSLLIAGMFMNTGCKKKKDTIAKIYVRDAQNLLVPDCRVVLKGVSTTNNTGNVTLYDTTYTNSAGEAIFNFNKIYKSGMAGVAILNIEARKNGLSGTGIIKVEEETTSTETVFIQP